MTEFETAMTNNFIIFNIVVAVLNIIVCGQVARMLKRGLPMSVLGFVVALPISILTAAIAVSAVAAFFAPGFLNTAADNAIGLLAWSAETGGEFGLFGIVAGLVGYVVVRVRTGRQTSPA